VATWRIGKASCVFRTADTRRYDNQASDGGIVAPLRDAPTLTRRHLLRIVTPKVDSSLGQDLAIGGKEKGFRVDQHAVIVPKDRPYHLQRFTRCIMSTF